MLVRIGVGFGHSHVIGFLCVLPALDGNCLLAVSESFARVNDLSAARSWTMAAERLMEEGNSPKLREELLAPLFDQKIEDLSPAAMALKTSHPWTR